MGQTFSGPTAEQIEDKERCEKRWKEPGVLCGSFFIPDEVSRAPEDCKHWYADFFNKVFVAPHRDGKSVVVFEPQIDETVEEIIMNVSALHQSFSLNGGHPRIVKYLHRLDPEPAYCLERLTPGPLADLKLPPLTLPVVSPSAQDRILLALYYRWALQSLSAFQHIHSKSVFLMSFWSGSLWLRTDMSIAVADFTQVDIVTPAPESDGYDSLVLHTHSMGGDDCFQPLGSLTAYDFGGTEVATVAYDLFDWAIWMWQLMTNYQSTDPPPQSFSGDYLPTLPMDPADWPDFTKISRVRYGEERQKNRQWQVLEEERLGNVLVKAWNQEYQNEEEVMEDVREVVRKMGMKLVGDDEIELQAGRWEDVFEVVRTGEKRDDQELRFAKTEKEIRV